MDSSSLHSLPGKTAVLYSAAGGSSPPEGSRRCLRCDAEILGRSKRQNVYCSSDCSQRHRRDKVIASWLAGDISGVNSLGIVIPSVKYWLRETRGNACEICSWDEVNPVTGIVPVVADHIDGDHNNNSPLNLRLICPNCDSLQPTYKALNKGNGRAWRRS